MDAVASIPPFETFYAEHAGEVLSLLRRRLGRERADDAFQETFLRALRAYDRLRHGDHLRAWVLTIAARVAIDAHRRAGEPTDELPDLAALRTGVPPTRSSRSSPTRSRRRSGRRSCSATGTTSTTSRSPRRSTRARRLHGRRPRPASAACEGGSHDRSHRPRPALPRAAARAELLDAAYDVIDSELGPLLAAVTDRGLARISFDPEPEQELESLARLAGRRVLRVSAGARRDPPRARRLLRRPPHRRSTSRSTCAACPSSRSRVLSELAKVPYGQTATYGELAERAGNPRASRAVGMVMNRNRDPDRAPVPPHRRRRPARSSATAAGSSARSGCCASRARSCSSPQQDPRSGSLAVYPAFGGQILKRPTSWPNTAPRSRLRAAAGTPRPTR